MDYDINEYGIKLLKSEDGKKTIQLISIVGEIE